MSTRRKMIRDLASTRQALCGQLDLANATFERAVAYRTASASSPKR
jgi:hypothetical protein